MTERVYSDEGYALDPKSTGFRQAVESLDGSCIPPTLIRYRFFQEDTLGSIDGGIEAIKKVDKHLGAGCQSCRSKTIEVLSYI